MRLCAANIIVFIPDAHALFTVVASVDSGKPTVKRFLHITLLQRVKNFTQHSSSIRQSILREFYNGKTYLVILLQTGPYARLLTEIKQQ